jgi:hypothetical protein
MKSITEIIKPIRLIRGSCSHTAKTGSGCVMNVIAYLNGDAKITDQSPCVCPSIRRELIIINDFLEYEDRQKLIPYIERAMGSVTDDKRELTRRLKCVHKYEQVKNNLMKVELWAVLSNMLYCKRRNAAFEFLDDILPEKSNVDDAVFERAKQLVAVKESAK